ncbi:MAG: ABC transporter ATP-binding protein [Planctomycetaceae bacterium]
MPTVPSRRRFARYRQMVRERNARPDTRAEPAASQDGDTLKRGHRQRTFLVLLKQFLQLVRGHWGSIAVALTLSTIAIALRLVPPYGTKLAIDCVLTHPAKPLPAWLQVTAQPLSPLGLLVAIAVVVVGITVVATIVGLMSRWMATKAVNKAQVSIRRRVFEHAIQLPLQRIYEMKSGGVASLIREDAGGIAELIFSLLYNPWRAIVQFCGSIVILMLVDWKLMVGGLLLLPAVWLTHRTWISRVRPLFKDIRKQRQRIDANATETFGGIRVVRTFARGHSESRRFIGEGDFLVRQQLYTWWWTRIIELVWEVVIPLASTALLLYGGYQILQGELTIGELMMFLVYLTMLLDPLATLAGSAVSFQNNLAGLDRVLDVLEQPAEFPSRPGAVALRRSQTAGAISIRGVSFAYPGSANPVLQGIDLEVEAGQTVALVGRSGAGKTTLTNLIARFYDPDAGSILLDGRDLRDIQLQSYRRLLGIVEQDVFLFDGTVRENIAYARANSSEDDIITAAQAAAADEFIRVLPEGYETIIGERGVKLSGGQRQRIAIARAILADPTILILDEATSNLDSESERLIQASLKELLRNRTAFVIAHRLSTIREADKIVVIEGGRIVQVGTHQQLVDRPGHYQDMIFLQMSPITPAAK